MSSDVTVMCWNFVRCKRDPTSGMDIIGEMWEYGDPRILVVACNMLDRSSKSVSPPRK